MMKTNYLNSYLMLALALSVFLSIGGPFARQSYAQANQPWYGSRSQNDVSVLLLAARDIRRELDVSREQRRMVEALADDLRAQQGSRGSTTDKILRVVLNEDQSKRLSQLRLQFEGPYAIEDTDFAKELKLTDEQHDAVVAVRKEKLVSNIGELKEAMGAEPLKAWRKRLGKTYEFSSDVATFREEYLKQRRFLEISRRRGR